MSHTNCVCVRANGARERAERRGMHGINYEVNVSDFSSVCGDEARVSSGAIMAFILSKAE